MTMPGIKAKRKQLVRKTLMRAKVQGERTAEQRQESPEEYAQTEVQQGVSDVAARTGNTAKSTARMSYRKFRAMQEKRKNLTLQGSTQSASKLTEKEKVTVPTQTERREMFKKQRFRQKAIAAKTPAPQAPVPSSATPALPPCRAQMQQHLKRQHLTREAVRRYLQKQTATTAAGNTAPIVTHAPKLPTISNKQATVEAISRGVHYIAAKIKALLSQTVRRAAQSLLALLGAGGVVLVLAMVIGAAAAVIGSPMGILFADESGDPNSIPIAEIVADTKADPKVLDGIDVLINVGDGDTAHTGGKVWEDPEISSAVKGFVHRGGGLIGVGEPGGHQYQGRYLQLSAPLGVEKETGFTLNYDKYNWDEHRDHFILADCPDHDVDFGEGKKNIFAWEGTEILIQRDKEVQMAAHEYGKGRGVYISGLPYSFVNNRVLYRAILWAAHDEADLHKWFSTNYNVEVHAYVKNGKYCVVNNTYEPQDTTVYTGDGSSFTLHMDANEIKWYNL